MKQLLTDIVAHIFYCLYRFGIRKNKIKVHSIEETIEELCNSNKSMVRFGDGEILIIRGKNLKLQDSETELSEALQRIISFEHEDLMVTISNIFGDLSIYRKESQKFWKSHLLFERKVYDKYCRTDKIYYDTFVSRFYYAFKSKDKCGEWVEAIKRIWENKDIVIVEGERTHNGVGNDLFDTARTIERIIGPANNAFVRLDDIEQCCRKYPLDRLFLLSLGAAAKVLAERLFLSGYRVLDIGNLDLEYEWYLRNADGKIKIQKHDIVSIEQNQIAGYDEYLSQIKERII